MKISCRRSLFKESHGAWKRRGKTGSFKTDSPTQVVDFGRVAENVLMPPPRIRPGGKQADHSAGAFFPDFGHGLVHPVGQRAPVGRIHPADAVPDLAQSVIFRREKLPALGVPLRGAHVQFTRPESGIQFRESPNHAFRSKNARSWFCSQRSDSFSRPRVMISATRS